MIREILRKAGVNDSQFFYYTKLADAVGLIPPCLSGQEQDALVARLEALGWRTKKITFSHNVINCPDRSYNSMIGDWVCPHGCESYSVAFWNPCDTESPPSKMSADSTDFYRV